MIGIGSDVEHRAWHKYGNHSIASALPMFQHVSEFIVIQFDFVLSDIYKRILKDLASEEKKNKSVNR